MTTLRNRKSTIRIAIHCARVGIQTTYESSESGNDFDGCKIANILTLKVLLCAQKKQSTSDVHYP